MKCTVVIWRSWVRTQLSWNLGCMVDLSKSYLHQKYLCPRWLSALEYHSRAGYVRLRSKGHGFESRLGWNAQNPYVLEKSGLKYIHQLPVHQSIWEPVHVHPRPLDNVHFPDCPMVKSRSVQCCNVLLITDYCSTNNRKKTQRIMFS